MSNQELICPRRVLLNEVYVNRVASRAASTLKSAIQKRMEVVYDYLLWLDPKQSSLLVIRAVGKALLY